MIVCRSRFSRELKQSPAPIVNLPAALWHGRLVTFFSPKWAVLCSQNSLKIEHFNSKTRCLPLGTDHRSSMTSFGQTRFTEQTFHKTTPWLPRNRCFAQWRQRPRSWEGHCDVPNRFARLLPGFFGTTGLNSSPKQVASNCSNWCQDTWQQSLREQLSFKSADCHDKLVDEKQATWRQLYPRDWYKRCRIQRRSQLLDRKNTSKLNIKWRRNRPVPHLLARPSQHVGLNRPRSPSSWPWTGYTSTASVTKHPKKGAKPPKIPKQKRKNMRFLGVKIHFKWNDTKIQGQQLECQKNCPNSQFLPQKSSKWR